MAGGYRFKKTRDGALKPKPNKDDPEGFSHVVDALQYVSLVVHGGLTDYVAQHIWGRKQRKRATPTSAAWT